MLSRMLFLLLLWAAPRLGDVGFDWSGFMGSMVVFYGFHNRIHGRSLFTSFLFTCYYFFVGFLIFSFFVFY